MKILVLFSLLINVLLVQATPGLVGYLLVTYTDEHKAVVPVGAEVDDGIEPKSFEFLLNTSPKFKPAKVYRFAYIPLSDGDPTQIECQVSAPPTTLFGVFTTAVQALGMKGLGSSDVDSREKWVEALKRDERWDEVKWKGWGEGGHYDVLEAYEPWKVKVVDLN